MQKQSERENSICKVVSGGVGHTFVNILILAKPNTGYDYDVKIMGHWKPCQIKQNPLWMRCTSVLNPSQRLTIYERV